MKQIRSFSELGVREALVDVLDTLGLSIPTPIQARTIPIALAGERDVVALAQTGTGKTAAFGVPVVQRTDAGSHRVQALVLCPTRELCLQVTRDLSAFGGAVDGLAVAAVYGGADINRQIGMLQRGAQIVVATPGRLHDLIRRNRIDLSGIGIVVLDEADEMLQMGFQEELNAILSCTPETRKTFLFSATMPPALSRIAAGYLKDPVDITIGRKNAGAENIAHVYCVVQARHRYDALERLVAAHPDMYGIVFCRTRQETKDVADSLMQAGFNADALHGDLSQDQRDWVMRRFRGRHLRLLVATDVAARGLDVDDLSHVINYCLPEEDAGYTHRSGRTGRAGKAGICISIIHMREHFKIARLEKKLGKSFVRGRVPTGREVFRSQALGQLAAAMSVTLDASELRQQMAPILPDIAASLQEIDREEIAMRFLALAMNRFKEYDYRMPDLNVPDRGEPAAGGKYRPFVPKYGQSKERPTREKRGMPKLSRFAINVGKRDGVNPGRLIGRINEASGSREIRIGRIDIGDRASMIEADSRFVRQVIGAFTGLMINGRPVSAEVVSDQPKKAAPHRKFGRRKTATRPRSFSG